MLPHRRNYHQSRFGAPFIDGRLYVPECWFGDDYAARRQACRMPADLRFQTEPEIALTMLTETLASGQLPFRWVTADEHLDEIPAFLEGIAANGKWYQVEVPVNTRVWLRPPSSRRGQACSAARASIRGSRPARPDRWSCKP